MTEPTTAFLNPTQSDAFLRDHWQRSAAFFPNGMRPLPAPPDWRSLAQDDAVESRRVITREAAYHLENGPLAPDDPTLPWTVLIQDADHHAPALRALIRAVDFLPRWRLEDVMLSAASAGGSVGPHVDAYDVFLVQARGQRRWAIGAQGNYQRTENDGGLRLVEPFQPEQTLVAQPGDVLYLPPDVPHHGVAIDDCITYSIGFRAPTLRDLATVALDQTPSDQRYRDAGATRTSDPALLDNATLGRLREQLQRFLALGDRALAAAMGELMTEPKPWLLDDVSDGLEHAGATDGRIATLTLRAATRVAHFSDDDGTVLFANGERYVARAADGRGMLRSLATDRHARCPNTPECQQLARDLAEDAVVTHEPG